MTPKELRDLEHRNFARRSSLVKRYAWKCKNILHRLNGPVSWDALHEMKSLQLELKYKIEELERLGHWIRPGDTTAKPATTGTATAMAPLTLGDACSCPTSQEGAVSRAGGKETRLTSDVVT